MAQELITLDRIATQKKQSVLKESFSSLLSSIRSTMASSSTHGDPRSISAGPQPMDTQAFSAAGGVRGIVSQMQMTTPGIGARDSHSRHGSGAGSLSRPPNWVRSHLTDKDLVTELLPNQELRDLSHETFALKPEPTENVRKQFKPCETWDPR